MGSYNIFSVESFEPEETSEEIIVTPPEIDENTNTNMQNIFSGYREEITDANRSDGFLEDLIASNFSYGTKENNIEEDIFKMTDKNSSTNTSTFALDPHNSAGNRTGMYEFINESRIVFFTLQLHARLHWITNVAGCLLPLEIKILLQLKLEEHFQPRPEESTRASYNDSFAKYLISALRNTTIVEFIGISESSSLLSPKAPHNDISQSVGVGTKEVQQNLVAVYDTGKPLSVTQVIPMTCDDFMIDSDTCYLVKASINVYISPDADKKIVKDAVIAALSHELTIFWPQSSKSHQMVNNRCLLLRLNLS